MKEVSNDLCGFKPSSYLERDFIDFSVHNVHSLKYIMLVYVFLDFVLIGFQSKIEYLSLFMLSYCIYWVSGVMVGDGGAVGLQVSVVFMPFGIYSCLCFLKLSSQIKKGGGDQINMWKKWTTIIRQWNMKYMKLEKGH